MKKEKGNASGTVEISLPYGHAHMTAHVPAELLNGIYSSALPKAAADPESEVVRAMDSPIGSVPLEELARGKRNAVVITSDHTRPVPSRIIMPEILRRLRRGSPGIDITILVATGFHRSSTDAELESKLGSEIFEHENIVVHDGSDPSKLIRLGTLPSGGELIVNKLAAETELLVAEGFIEPHFFAGFSGGRKSVLPGIASRQTVFANHCSEFIQSPFSRTGILENNPIHRDMLYAAERVRLAFIVNVVLDGEKRIVKAFAGDSRKAHEAGCEFLRSFCGIRVPESEIVVTSNGGYPLDQNVYQSVKGMTAAEAVCRPGGVIVMVSSCSDGVGGDSFYRNLSQAESPQALLDRIASVPRNRTEADQWQFQIFARILARYTVILVTRECPHKILTDMHLKASSTLGEALSEARKIAGEKARIAVIPDGVSVIAQKL